MSNKAKLNKGVFHATRVTFGLAHLLVQSTADLIVEVETSIVKKTGYEGKNGKMKSFNEETLSDYKQFRRDTTKEIQNSSRKKCMDLVNKLRKKELKTA